MKGLNYDLHLDKKNLRKITQIKELYTITTTTETINNFILFTDHVSMSKIFKVHQYIKIQCKSRKAGTIFQISSLNCIFL